MFEEFTVAHHSREPVDPPPPVRGGKVDSNLKNGAGVETMRESYIKKYYIKNLPEGGKILER